jgi:hypothetical protein
MNDRLGMPDVGGLDAADAADPRAIPREMAEIFDRLASWLGTAGPLEEERPELEALLRRCATVMRAWAELGQWPARRNEDG